MGEAVAPKFDAFAAGDVDADAAHPQGAALRIVDGSSHGVDPSHVPVGANDAVFAVEADVVADGAIDLVGGGLPIIRMENGAPGIERSDVPGRIKSEEAEQLRGPRDVSAGDVPVPKPRAGRLLRECQAFIDATELTLRPLLLGDVPV